MIIWLECYNKKLCSFVHLHVFAEIDGSRSNRLELQQIAKFQTFDLEIGGQLYL